MLPDTAAPQRTLVSAGLLAASAALIVFPSPAAAAAPVHPAGAHPVLRPAAVRAQPEAEGNPQTVELTEHRLMLDRYEKELRDDYAGRHRRKPVIHPALVAVAAAVPPAAPTPSPQPAATTAPPRASGSPQEYAESLVGAAQFACLDPLWERESGWQVDAYNASSGAYGIPQALPGGKMASAGADWQTDADTQIRWGISYIDDTYGSPCGAWEHEEADGWY
jgi:hypothetical protein